MSGFSYNKWDHIELSSDEDKDCPPSVDKSLMRRIQKEKRANRDQNIALEKAKLEKDVEAATQQMQELQANAGPETQEQIGQLRQENQKRADRLREIELNKKWNSHNICKVKEESTIVNKSSSNVTKDGYIVPQEKLEAIKAKMEANRAAAGTAAASDDSGSIGSSGSSQVALKATDEDTMEGYNEFVAKHKALLDKFMNLSSLETTEQMLLANADVLFTEHASSYFLLACLKWEMDGKRAKMKRIARQSQILSNITALASQANRHPGSFINVFFKKATNNTEFKAGVDGFIEKVIARAIEKKEQAAAEAEGEEMVETEVALSEIPLEERLGPGGLDPVEVFDSLPQALKDAFSSRELEPLKKALGGMEPKDAEYHMERCTKAGLWNPDGASGN